jgi:hypothetical protein
MWLVIRNFWHTGDTHSLCDNFRIARYPSVTKLDPLIALNFYSR